MSTGELLAHVQGVLAEQALGPGLRWWAGLAILGLVFLPVSRRLLPGSVDGGYTAGKLLALLLASYLAWLGGLAGLGVLSIPARAASALGLVLLVLAASRRARDESGGEASRVAPRLPWRAIALCEAGFALALLAGVFARSLEPSLATTEKFMDFGFVNSILHAPSLPPPDPWYAGETINYYYFGHFVTAYWIRVTAVPAAVGYNLMVATLFAASAATAGTLGFDAMRLRGPTTYGEIRLPLLLLAAGLSGLLLVAAGNLHPVLYGGSEGYHHVQATRFVGFAPETGDKLITEFPAFAFALGDLHAHLLNLPFTLVFLHLLVALLRDGRERGAALRLAGIPIRLLACAGLLLGTSWMTNSWDAPLYAGLLGLALLLTPGWPGMPRGVAGAGSRLARSGLGVACAVAAGLAVCLPFVLSFEPFGRGLGWVSSRTPLLALGILYGWQLAVAVVYLALGRARGTPDLLDRWLLLLVAGALVCIATHELVHVIDGLPADYRRANTVFKLGFQAFVLLTLAAGPMVAASLAQRRSGTARLALAAALAMAVLPPLRFAPLATEAMLASPLRQAGRPTLDGLAQTFARNPEDAAIAAWLDRHGRGQGNLLESYGASFGYGARMSVFTGIPDVVGWLSHEALWRPQEPVALRRQAVDTAFTCGDVERVRGILDRYDVGFVVVGELERLVFENLDEAPFQVLAERVLEVGRSRLYRVRRSAAAGDTP